MTHISAIKSQRFSPLQSSKWDYFKNLANMVCSREPFYRAALDLSAFDIPVMLADLFRGYKKFLETAFETLTGTMMIFVAPVFTAIVGKIMGFFILPKDMRKDALHYLRFTMEELRDKEKFQRAVKGDDPRIIREECEDKEIVSSLYEKLGNSDKAIRYKNESREIRDFYKQLDPTEEKMKLAYKLKKWTTIAESLLEGIWWGGTGLIMRAFRKYILRENRFTGTMNYASNAESKKLGEAGSLNLFQTIVGLLAIPTGAIVNWFLLTKAEDEKAVEKSSFLKIVRSQFDMTHGLYPKLGLLFSMSIVPKYVGVLTTAQGWYERIERLLRLVTVVPSWWCGHWLTNGVFALNADKYLSKKYSVEPGILVEPEYFKSNENDSLFEKLTRKLPEPAKIHHVMKSTKGKEALQNEAEDLHARSFYKGFVVHSIFVWLINMGVNYITKLRVKSALGH